MDRRAHELQSAHLSRLYQLQPWEFQTYYSPPKGADERRQQHTADEYVAHSALSAEDRKQYEATKEEVGTPKLPIDAVAYYHSDEAMVYPIRIRDPALIPVLRRNAQERQAKQWNTLLLPSVEQELRSRLHGELHKDRSHCDCFAAAAAPPHLKTNTVALRY